METNVKKDHFRLISEAIVKNSGGNLEVISCKNKKMIQGSIELVEEHYLELEGKKIGNNIEFYIEKSKTYKFKALPDFFLILLKIKDDCPESYRIGAMMLKKVGSEIFEGKILENWNNLFK